MEFAKETKRQFVTLFGRREIVTISNKYGTSRTSYEHKFIGVHEGLKWDFTPLVIYMSGCEANRSGLAARGLSEEILKNAFLKLREEGFTIPNMYLYSTSDFCQTFYF